MLLPFFYPKPAASERETSLEEEAQDDGSIDHNFSPWFGHRSRPGRRRLVRVAYDARPSISAFARRNAVRRRRSDGVEEGRLVTTRQMIAHVTARRLLDRDVSLAQPAPLSAVAEAALG